MTREKHISHRIEVGLQLNEFMKIYSPNQKRVVSIAVLIVSLWCCFPALGQLIRREENLGRCRGPWGGARYTIRFEGTRRYITSATGNITVDCTEYRLRGWPPGVDTSWGGDVCDEFVCLYFINNPTGPQIPIIWHKFQQQINDVYDFFLDTRHIQLRNPPDWIPPKTRCGCGGVRGSLESPIVGSTLVTSSPDIMVNQLVLTESDLTFPQRVYVSVDYKQEEDWFSLGVQTNAAIPEVTFFKQPMSEFETNQWYGIDVPSSLLIAGTNFVSHIVHSRNGTNTSMFIALGTREVFAPTFTNVQHANNEVKLQLGNLRFGANYVVEATTGTMTHWHPVMNFSAYNNTQPVNVSSTNSAMFYRLARPLQ